MPSSKSGPAMPWVSLYSILNTSLSVMVEPLLSCSRTTAKDSGHSVSSFFRVFLANFVSLYFKFCIISYIVYFGLKISLISLKLAIGSGFGFSAYLLTISVTSWRLLINLTAEIISYFKALNFSLGTK